MSEAERALLLWVAKIQVMNLDGLGLRMAGDRGAALIAAVERERPPMVSRVFEGRDAR